LSKTLNRSSSDFGVPYAILWGYESAAGNM
jgi:hypothetical protein